MRRMIVTPEQFIAGYVEYRPGEIPNMIHHEFNAPVKLSTGNYEVDEPGNKETK